MGNRRQIICVLLLSILSVVLISCTKKPSNTADLSEVSQSSTEEKQTGITTSETSFVDYSEETLTTEVTWEKDGFPFLKPPADSFEIDKRFPSHPLRCRGISTDELEVYFSQLLDDGWKRAYHVEETSYFSFLKGNERLSIVLEEDGDSGSFLMSYDSGYTGGSRDGEVSKAKAFKYISKSYLKEISDPDISAVNTEVKTVRELDDNDLFEKTEMQIFEAFGERGEIGTFLVAGEMACWISADSGFSNNTSVFLADVDKDGKLEVLDSYRIGSGVSYFGIYAYKFGISPNSNSPKKVIYAAYDNHWMEGMPRLEIQQKENYQVHLCSYLYDYNKGAYVLDEDFGALGVEDGKLVPENNEKLQSALPRVSE